MKTWSGIPTSSRLKPQRRPAYRMLLRQPPPRLGPEPGPAPAAAPAHPAWPGVPSRGMPGRAPGRLAACRPPAAKQQKPMCSCMPTATDMHARMQLVADTLVSTCGARSRVRRAALHAPFCGTPARRPAAPPVPAHGSPHGQLPAAAPALPARRLVAAAAVPCRLAEDAALHQRRDGCP
jgi:hypothetical protein